MKVQPGLFDLPAPARTRVTLYHGDCLEVMKRIEPSSVNFIFADLPYGCTDNRWDSSIDLALLQQAIFTLGRDNLAFVCTATQPFATALIVAMRQFFRYDLTYLKVNAVGFLNSKRQPLRAHEHCLVFYKRQPTFNPQMTEGNKPWVSRKKNSGSKNWAGPKLERPKSSGGLKRYPLSFLGSFGEPRMHSLHPTQKPVALLEYLIRTYTNEGDTVLDPTAGSGTTAIAAMRTGRHCIAIEKDPIYFEVMRKRVADERVRLGHGL